MLPPGNAVGRKALPIFALELVGAGVGEETENEQMEP